MAGFWGEEGDGVRAGYRELVGAIADLGHLSEELLGRERAGEWVGAGIGPVAYRSQHRKQRSVHGEVQYRQSVSVAASRGRTQQLHALQMQPVVAE
ncbi:hypothetical protein [Streptomyces sp. NPDC048637]|uniref:hypothetical protein n=1 Tax=Streptomyces sp. NPDC048637 TaxID=3155636 RepID=UPI003416685C